MGNFGRYVCVALPFAMTLASLIALLVATLAGVADKNLYMFQVNMTDFQIAPTDLVNFIGSRAVEPRNVAFHDPSLLSTARQAASSGTVTGNKTAADLGFFNLYDVGLWGYCYTPQNGSRACTATKFNWAEGEFNTTEQNLDVLSVSLAGQKIKVPKAITDAMNAFSTISRWTQIVFVVAIVALGVELFFGIFATCTRVMSCLTFLVAGIALVAVCAAAALATAMSVVVVGTLEATAKFYGVTASFNTRFLAAVWIAAAFAIGAGLFWLFTICCCAPDHHARRSSRKRHQDAEGEKFLPPGAYQPIHDPYSARGANGGGYGGHQSQQYGYAGNAPAPRRDLAYEPYTSTHV